VNCNASQVILVSGVGQAIYLLTRLLVDPGERVWMEEPGFPAAVQAFRAAGARAVPVAVDGDGLDIEAGIRKAPDARLVFLSPANHFPVGSTMSLERRLRLLQWAAAADAYILEDDYDSEFRYDSRPIPALQSLDHYNRVIYLGSTITMGIYPGIRMDYVVLPPSLVEMFLAARTIIDMHLGTLNQAVTADFISEGHFTRHIRRMRIHYKKRRDALVQAVQENGPNLLQLGNASGGFHLVGWLPPGVRDEHIYFEANKIGIEALPLSRFYLAEPDRQGIILGFAASEPENIRWGVEKLLQIIDRTL
jgi:GntR family transcriptional regulator/MocR family aminotransferase